MPSAASAAVRSRWAGIPAEDRRAARRDRLVDTAFDLLGSGGDSAVTVRAVCQHAQLNPRYFYESFDDLDSLLIAVYERTVDELTACVLGAIEDAGDDTRAQTHAAIDAIVGFVDEDRRRGRILYTEALGNEALNRQRVRTGRALVALVERSARARHGALPAGEAIGKIGAAILVGGFSGLLQGWLAGRIEVPRQQLVEDSTTLFLALGETAGRIAQARRPPKKGNGKPRQQRR